MTPEMIELEFAHIALDRKLKGGSAEQFEDPEFEAYDKEYDEKDSRLSDSDLPVYQPIQVSDPQWEDVEDEEE